VALPKWAQWQIDNPPAESMRRANMRAWRMTAWDVRLWLFLSALVTAFGVIAVVAIFATHI
jgi:hypothetical protein